MVAANEHATEISVGLGAFKTPLVEESSLCPSNEDPAKKLT